MSKMKTYMVETQVSFTLRRLVRASTPAKAEQAAIDTMNYDDLDYDTARVLTASAEERPEIDAKRYCEIKYPQPEYKCTWTSEGGVKFEEVE